MSEDYARLEQRPDDQKELYARLAATMSFLINRYGESKVESMFFQFYGGKSLDEVFEFIFGEKILDIEREWVKALTSQAK